MSSITSTKPFTSNLPPPVVIPLKEGESIRVESGAMLAFKNLSLSTQSSGTGFWSTLKNYVLGGESLFVNIYTANQGDGWIALEENQPGQLVKMDLNPKESGFIIRRGAYIASSPNVKLETVYAGFGGLMQGKGLATTTAKVEEGDKSGLLYFQSPNGIPRVFHISQSDGPVIIDNDMILGHTEGLNIATKRIGGGVKSFFLSGEGLACEISGEGDVFVVGKAADNDNNATALASSSIAEKGLALSCLCIGILGIFVVGNKIGYTSEDILNAFAKIS